MSLASDRLLEYPRDVRLMLASCSGVCTHEVDMRDISSAGGFEVWNDNAVNTTLPEYSMHFEQEECGAIPVKVLKKVRVIDCVDGFGWKRYPSRQVVHDNVGRQCGKSCPTFSRDKYPGEGPQQQAPSDPKMYGPVEIDDVRTRTRVSTTTKVEYLHARPRRKRTEPVDQELGLLTAMNSRSVGSYRVRT